MASHPKASKSSAARRGAVLAVCALCAGGLAVGLVAQAPAPAVPPQRSKHADADPSPVRPSVGHQAPAPETPAEPKTDGEKAFLCVIEGVTAQELTAFSISVQWSDGTVRQARFDSPPSERDGAFLMDYDGPDIVGFRLEADGFLPTDGTIVGGRCTERLVVERAASVRVRLEGLLGDDAWVEGCGDIVWGGIREVVLEAPPGQMCTYTATRVDGHVHASSEPVTVRVSPQHGADLTLHLPEHLQGGIGATLDEAPEGVVLLDLRTDGTGAAEGLRPGDTITRVNSQSTVGWSADEFEAEVMGDDGTSVELTALRDGKSFDVVVTRGALDDGREFLGRSTTDPSTHYYAERPGLWMGEQAGEGAEATEWESFGVAEEPGIERMRELRDVE